MSKVYSLKTVQVLKTNIDEAWDFFSSPKNLQKITPEHLGFQIICQHHGEKMYAGQLIEYKVSPVLGIPLYWMTEITHVEDKKFFVDEQRFGPYALWHHKHFIKAIDGGVEMEDIIDYKVPMGWLGQLVHPFLVKPKLEEIFAYRQKKLIELFGDY